MPFGFFNSMRDARTPSRPEASKDKDKDKDTRRPEPAKAAAAAAASSSSTARGSLAPAAAVRSTRSTTTTNTTYVPRTPSGSTTASPPPARSATASPATTVRTTTTSTLTSTTIDSRTLSGTPSSSVSGANALDDDDEDEVPTCPRCDEPGTYRVTRASSRTGNGGRPYYKCFPCDKFITFADNRGADPDNPVCFCSKPSRRLISGEAKGSKIFYKCFKGKCTFYEEEDITTTLRKLRVI